MKKTNILIEVSDELYDNVVYPMKRQKRFSKLIVMLLEGYYSNDYISAYIDGNVDAENKEGIEALDSVLNDMKSTISLMGMNTSELEQNTNEGLGIFSGVHREGNTENNQRGNKVGTGIPEKPNGYVSVDEFDKLKAEFEEAKRQNENIMNMLSSIMKAGFSNQGSVSNGLSGVTQNVVSESNEGSGVNNDIGSWDSSNSTVDVVNLSIASNDSKVVSNDEDNLSISGMDNKDEVLIDDSNPTVKESKPTNFDMSLLDDVSIDIEFNDEVEDEEEDTTNMGSDIFADLMSDAIYEF